MELITIITPIFNSEDFLQETLDSVFAQTYTNWEMFLIDDCSTDQSYEIAKQNASNDKRIKIVKFDKNSGAASARNAGINLANGRYIAFVDSDDLWSPNKLDKQIEFMKTTNCHLSFTAYEKITEKGHHINNVGVPSTISYHELLKTNVMGCFTVIYDLQYFGKVEMPNILKRQDYAFWLKLLKSTEKAHGLNDVLGKYRVRNNSLSANKLKAAAYNWTLYRDIEKLSIFKCLYYFSHYASKGFLRTKMPKLARILGILD